MGWPVQWSERPMSTAQGPSEGAPPPLNLDNLNLAPLCEQTCVLLSELERYCRNATAYGHRWCQPVGQALTFAALHAIPVEAELARLGLELGRHPNVVQGQRERWAAVRLADLLVHLRGGGAENWGVILAGGVWASFHLGSGDSRMPNLAQEVLQLQCIVDDLRECQPAPGLPERTNAKQANAPATPNQARKGKMINERMLARLQKEPESMLWSARQWADALGCSKSTIAETTTWKNTLQAIKAKERTEREMRQERHRGHSDDD
jgi:hypothetical protein